MSEVHEEVENAARLVGELNAELQRLRNEGIVTQLEVESGFTVTRIQAGGPWVPMAGQITATFVRPLGTVGV